jgi:hypothetical protein
MIISSVCVCYYPGTEFYADEDTYVDLATCYLSTLYGLMC